MECAFARSAWSQERPLLVKVSGQILLEAIVVEIYGAARGVYTAQYGVLRIEACRLTF